MKNQTSYTLLLFLLVLSSALAQNTISGKVLDTLNNPIPFANVILYQAGNKELITGVISNDEGLYVFESIENGKYQLEISVLGFELKKSDLSTEGLILPRRLVYLWQNPTC